MCQDEDGDGFAAAECGGDDCNDTNAAVNPGASETDCNGIDDDCDGRLAATEDADRDGRASTACGGADCDDEDPTSYPGATELCDGADNDCDGSAVGEDLDGDEHLASTVTCSGGPLADLPLDDCDDADEQRYPGVSELCNEVDDDCDDTIDEDCMDAACLERVPTADFGATPDRKLSGFTLQDCSGSDYSFYNQDFCEAELTVINVAAGWCPPCIAESEQLESEINDFYAGQGVRVIQILTQTADYSAPDLTYCAEWVERFGLSNIELIDPAQNTGIFYPDNSLPSSIVVDGEGVIRFRENGATDGFVTLKAAIDSVLSAP